MNFLDLLLIAVGLSMDAFSVAICKGLAEHDLKASQAGIVGLYFGLFQALMPIIGYVVGAQFAHIIQDWDHWIAFGLLAFLGGRMVYEASHEEDCPIGGFDFKHMFPLAIATSIDALAVGVTFSFLKINIWVSALEIGICTFLLSFLGTYIGNRFGQYAQKPAEISGGVILILIGLKILLEHLGILSW